MPTARKIDLNQHTAFLSSLRVLVAEDAADSRMLVQRILQSMGFGTVVAVANGGDAWTKIREAANDGKPFDLVVSDWNMPGLDGMSLLRKVREHEGTSELPFLMLTGKQEAAQVRLAIGAKVSNYIAKPFSADDFVPKVIDLMVAHQKKKT